MCFELDARPPELPAGLRLPLIAGGAAAELLELVSEDGTRFSAALAESPRPSRLGVVILPDVRGLYPFYSELAERFADAGRHAIALDYFGRTAGVGPRGEGFEAMPHVHKTRPERIQQDAAAALAALRERTGTTVSVAVGFCFGGTQAYLAATSSALALDGVVGFYGGLDGTRFDIPSPPDVVERISCPVLGLYGGADAGITTDAIDHFESRLEQAGVEHDIVVYPGAPHSFFDRSFEQHADACEDAWRRVLGFLDRVP